MPVKWLSAREKPDALPAPGEALDEPNGLLAAGGSLTPEWLLAAYRTGIFPWYEEGQPILWWSPDPRAVLWPRALHVSRSLRKTIRRRRFRVTADTAFADVVAGCAAPRGYTTQTWITREMAVAYEALHRDGWAHSFEAWHEDELAGGLYGVCIGGVFFGESMFARKTDASKVALASAVAYFEAAGIELIDCQIPSTHMASLGAIEIARVEFLEHLSRFCDASRTPKRWTEAHRSAEQHVSAV